MNEIPNSGRSGGSCRMPLLLRLSHHPAKTNFREYLSARMLDVGGTFIQGESEVASINMVLGASVAGGRRHDILIFPRGLPQAGGDLVHGGNGTSSGHYQHDAGRSRTREISHLRRPIIFRRHSGRRPRRLPDPPYWRRPGGQELVDLTFVAFDLGRQVPQSGHDPGRRPDGDR